MYGVVRVSSVYRSPALCHRHRRCVCVCVFVCVTWPIYYLSFGIERGRVIRDCVRYRMRYKFPNCNTRTSWACVRACKHVHVRFERGWIIAPDYYIHVCVWVHVFRIICSICLSVFFVCVCGWWKITHYAVGLMGCFYVWTILHSLVRSLRLREPHTGMLWTRQIFVDSDDDADDDIDTNDTIDFCVTATDATDHTVA